MRTPRHPRSRRSAFTLVEVLFATFVLAMAIGTSVTTLGSGFRQIDTARDTTLAGQILQSLVEDVRMRPWATGNGTTGVIDLVNLTDRALSDFDATGSFNFNGTATALLGRFKFSRTIADAAGMVDMKVIVFEAKWTGIDGKPHSAKYTTYYAKNGLYDYYYN